MTFISFCNWLPPSHPATAWGGTGPKRTVPSSSSHPDQTQPLKPPVLAEKCKNPTDFNPKFKELDLLLRPPIQTSKWRQEWGCWSYYKEVTIILFLPSFERNGANVGGSGDWWSNVGNLVEDVIRLLAQLDVRKGIYQPRQGNGVAHALAQFGLRHGQYFVWEDVAPPWLIPLIDRDIDGET
ncbi:hypothetical protein L3X38_033823 [Prunus dulcis]|uniref:Uncharacterized protein n=1 Tax=Prunus dulcis TaxID=3755 RepID=A0AAD4VGM9_PRUDU|nr:hypothetical protein L3X38_033823 [Prunus dulcis]